MTRNIGDVFRSFEPPFNFETANARLDEFRHEVIGGKVLRTQQVFDVAQVDVIPVAYEVVRQAAGLRALAPVCAAATERFARETLARIGHAQRPVNKYLELN